MVKVKLNGILGKEFGEEWNLKVQSPREAVRAIVANNPIFKTFLYANKNLFLKFRVNGEWIKDRKHLCAPMQGIKEIEIDPVFMGSMNQSTFGIIQIVAGAILIIVGIILIAISWATFGTTAIVGIGLIFVGLALLASGVITLLTPGPEGLEQRSQRRSNLFDSAAETTVQGIPIPLIYGTMFVEGFPVASSILTKDDARTVAMFERERQKEAEQAAKDAERARKKAEKQAKKDRKKKS